MVAESGNTRVFPEIIHAGTCLRCFEHLFGVGVTFAKGVYVSVNKSVPAGFARGFAYGLINIRLILVIYGAYSMQSVVACVVQVRVFYGLC